MIDRQEILKFPREVGLDSNVVEKDHVLGSLPAGISQHPRTRDTWLFKGGTRLKSVNSKRIAFRRTFARRFPVELSVTWAIHAPHLTWVTSPE